MAAGARETLAHGPAGRRVLRASSSLHRRTLLARLGLPFESQAPVVDESALPGLPLMALVRLLATLDYEVLAALPGNALGAEPGQQAGPAASEDAFD